MLVGFVWFGHDVVVRLQPEMQEVREKLLEGDFLKRRFEFVADVDPVPLPFRWRRFPSLASADSRQREWRVVRNATGVSGHFTFEVSGWRKVLDQRRALPERIVVYFEKVNGGPMTITRIDGFFIRYPVDPEWEKILPLLEGSR